MRIFLGFGNLKLSVALVGQILAESVCIVLFAECDSYVFKRCVVLGKANVFRI